MATYAILFTFTGETVKALMDNPAIG